MDLSNIVQLVVPQTQPLERRDQIQGPEREAEFLSLKLVNKRGRVRLSPAGIDYNKLPGKSSLFAVGNKKGLFAAAIRKEDNSHHILVSTLSELQIAFESGRPDPEPFIPFTARCSPLSVPGTPIILKFALNDERLVVGFLEGPILIYAANDLFTLNQGGQPDPILSLPGDASTIPRDILPNPGDTPELVAIMRGVHGQEPGHQIDVIDVRELKNVAGWRKGGGPHAAPVSISWSPKGKQIAIGLQSGDMLLYSPMSPGTPKSHLFKARSAPDDGSSLLSTNWLLSPTTFYTIYSTPEASSTLFDPSTSDAPTQTHFISAHDTKYKYAVDVGLRDPCPPFGARRPPGPLVVVLRNWSPTRFIIFCGGGPSSDIGVVGTLPSNDPSKPGDQWGNFNLEETSTASLPLDEELNDLALLGLEVDLTSSKPIRMSEQPDDGTPDLPPSPILYAYTNDGTVVAWHVLNNSGEAYPGMTVVSASHQPFGTSSPRFSPASQDTASVFNETSASSSSPPASAFGQAVPPSSTVAPAQGFGAFANVNTSSQFGSTGFGFGGGSAPPNSGGPSSTTTFGSTSFGSGNAIKPAPSFGTTGFGGAGTSQTALQTPPSSAFGTTGFGQPSAAPAFGVSAFGSKPAAPAFGQSGFGITPSGVAKPAATFGSTGGGFASYATSQGNFTSKAPSPSPSAFGQASFGQTSSPSTSTSAFGAGGQGQASSPASAFGSGGVGQAKVTTSTPAFGQQEPKPQSAFGNFRESGSGSAFARTGSSQQDSSGLGGLGALGDALKPSAFSARVGAPQDSPPSPTDSLPESPELRPAALPAKPISSYLKPAEGFGTLQKSQSHSSFGGEKPTSPYTKPAGGFGSISQPNLPSHMNEQKPTMSPVASMTPTFGSPSVLGPAKPIFGSSSFGSAPQRPAAELSNPTTGGFSAFSSDGGGFASFANAGKSASFADILSSGEPEKPKSTTPLAFGSTSSYKPSNASAFRTRADPEVSSPPTENSAATFSTRTARAGGSDSDEEREGTENRVSEEKLANQGPSLSSTKEDNPSPSHFSLGEAPLQATPSSIPRPEVSSRKSENESVATNMEENVTELEEEDTASEPFSLTEDGESVSDEGEQLPRSPTRSLSEEEVSARVSSHNALQEQIPQSTPTPELENTTKASEVKVLSPPPNPTRLPSSVEEASTTPPGSPEKPATISQNALPTPVAPTPIMPASTISPFGLGLGRPSSRPIRSSPLASAPITSTGDDESIPAPSTTKPSEPEKTVEQPSRSASASVPSIQPSAITGDTLTSKPRRPKTPPLLSTPTSIPGPVPPPPSSTIAPGQPRISPPANSTSLSEAEEDMPQHPMQVEFLRAYQDMTKELVQLYKEAQEMTMIRPVISEPRGLDTLVLNNQEFVPGQYSHGDLRAFTKMIEILQKKILPLLEQGNANKCSLRILQSSALISETKQEEVVRWVRARQDPDFAKTLNPRTLGPEHSETQTRLRKAVQMARDRIQKCEDGMESLKKRLEQHKSGKFGLRPPSLDTIDRTCRNIQLALEERIKLFDQLQDQIENLSPKASQRLQSTPHQQSPVSKSNHVTPPFASVAAAALNSERSSLRLKTALFTARKEPLLTTKIIKLETSKAARPDTRLLSQSHSQRPEWKLPPDERNSRGSGLSKQEIGDDSEWDQEAEQDYRRN